MTHSKIKDIFQYLKDYNNKRNPLKRNIKDYEWYLKIEELPEHHRVKIGSFIEKGGELTGDDFILKVQRPNLTKPPMPPNILENWLKRGWERADGNIDVKQSRNEQDENGKTIIVQFNDDQRTVDAFKRWKKNWEEWARNELPALAASKLFEKLFALYGMIEREAEKVEIVLGDGIISFDNPNDRVHHPILLQKLQLEFDPETPIFILRETDHPVELSSSLFLEVPGADGNLIAKYKKNLNELPIHPFGGTTTTAFFKRLIQSLSYQGEFVETGEPVGTSDHIRIGRAPCIFMCNRALGFASAIDSILADLQARQDFSPALLNVVGIEAKVAKDAEVTAPRYDLSGGGNEDTDVLFSKPANTEQLEIARKLDIHGCVLVQGPPGTGKTQTIANLIGHLLAQGKRILVTSHTTKSLRVLREHVVEELRPLCVSVLERDSDSRKQLESAITTIDEKFTSLDLDVIGQNIQTLKQQRNVIVDDLKKIRHELKLARGDEYRDVVVAGSIFAPSQAAIVVADGINVDDWIPGPLLPGEPLPFAGDEISKLYCLNEIIDQDAEKELQDNSLPDISVFLSSDDFEKLVLEKRRLSERDLHLGESFWIDCNATTVICPCGVSNRLRVEWLGFASRCKKCKQKLSVASGHEYSYESLGIHSLNNLSLKVHSCTEPLCTQKISEWSLMIVQDGMRGSEIIQTWNTLLNHIEDTKKKAASTSEWLIKYAPEIVFEGNLDQTLIVLDQIKRHITHGKPLSWITFKLHKEWKNLIDRCKINSQSPKTTEHFQALIAYAELANLRISLVDRWARMITFHGGPVIDQGILSPEMICTQFVDSISYWINWHQKQWMPLEKELSTTGLKMQDILNQQPPVLSKNGEIIRLTYAIKNLPVIIEMRANRLRFELIKEQLKLLSEAIFAKSVNKSSFVLNALKEAIDQKNCTAYQRAIARLNELISIREQYFERCKLLAILNQAAPKWASLIRDRVSPHDSRDMPGNVQKAWLWRQLDEELDRRASKSIPEMQKKIEDFKSDLARITTVLIFNLAWGRQLSRLSGQIELRHALKAWMFVMRQIGAGKGKKVPILSREAKRLMVKSQDAVPVWIMPLSRVVENFDPTKTHFDVVIIDEASQSDPLGLTAFYMADKVVVVGDHEQVSPDAVGVTNEIALGLIDLHLSNFDNKMLFLPTSSVYELARASFGATVQLNEHFRCVPDIIQFSNHLSYDGRIKPLRDASASALLPHVVAYRVDGATSDNKVNDLEAEVTASLMVAAMEQSEYDGKEFGLISLVGEDQALRIEKIIREHLPPSEIESRRLVCGNPPQFQGDERHIMFLSMVDAPIGGGPLARREAGQNDMWKKRYNVAASRAKDQMWIIYSLNPSIDLKPGDIRRRLIEHALNPMDLTNILKQGAAQTESEFERRVLERLLKKEFKVTPQWWVGKYRIDLVISGNGKRLAVECDGDKYHTPDNLVEDMARQAILERLGWTFVRIRGTEFFRNPDKAILPVFAKLKDMGIEPLGSAGTIDNIPQDDLKERIISRANQIRKEWADGTYIFRNAVLKPIHFMHEDLIDENFRREDKVIAKNDEERVLTDHHVDVCMNLNTGKYFLCIDGSADGARLEVITPEGRSLNMNADLFDEPIEKGINYLVVNDIITKAQLSAYSEYTIRHS